MVCQLFVPVNITPDRKLFRNPGRLHVAHSGYEGSEVYRAQKWAFRQWPSLDWLRDAIKVRTDLVLQRPRTNEAEGPTTREFRRGLSGCMETGESYWVSGVKKDGQDRHWAGSGKVLIERVPSRSIWIRLRPSPSIRRVAKSQTLSPKPTLRSSPRLANSPGRGWPDDPASGPYSFVRNVTLSSGGAEPAETEGAS